MIDYRELLKKYIRYAEDKGVIFWFSYNGWTKEEWIALETIGSEIEACQAREFREYYERRQKELNGQKF